MNNLLNNIIARYKVSLFINNKEHLLYVGNNIDEAELVYNDAIEQNYSSFNTCNKKVYLYDYDKDTNIKSYDTAIDVL